MQVYVYQPSRIEVMDLMAALNLDSSVGIILSHLTPSPNVPAANIINNTIYLKAQEVFENYKHKVYQKSNQQASTDRPTQLLTKPISGPIN